MGRSLRLLERSVASGCKHKQRPEGMTSLNSWQEQIAVVRGQHVGQPTGAMRALEERVLGHPAVRSPLIPTYLERETLRLDQEQLAPHHYASAPTVVPTLPAAALPASEPVAAYSSQAYSSNPYHSHNYHSPAYAPEFSAPDTGRFQVESFTDDLFASGGDGNAAGAPTIALPDFSIPPINANFNDAGAPNATSSRAPAAAPVFDDSDWISAAQNDRPAKITAASKQALNPGLALAKDDFERELAAILGTEALVAPAAPSTDPLFVPPAVTQPASPPPAAAKPAAEPEVIHPNHSVFDQMGLAMRYANSFDLGNVSLKNRFDQFEKDLEVNHSAAQRPQPASVQSMSNLFVDPMNLDEFDLVAELAEIGVENPAAAVQTPQVQAPQVQIPQAQTPQGQPAPVIESQQPITAPALAPDAVPVKPAIPLDPNAPLTIHKPINRTETTAGDDHE